MHAISSAATLTQTGSGDDGDRTRDLVVANHALSQLSYIPAAEISNPKNQIPNKPAGLGIWHLVLGISLHWVYVDSNHGPQLYQSCALAN